MGRQPVVPLAKLRPPDLGHALPRPRLHAWLDASGSSALWVCGPPGAGKTTLAASHVRHLGVPALWYRLDGDDNDVGRFFATFGQAVDEIQPRIRRPSFAPDHLADAGAYARRWFRAVHGALPKPLCIVFDNLEQSPLACLAELLGCAIDEAVDGLTLVFTCRHAPPAELAARVLGGRLAVLPADELRFTPSEAADYARLLALPEAAVARAAERVDGWAAGLRLLSHAGGGAGSPEPGGLLFDYFAGLLHAGLDPATQSLLLHGAPLPWIDSGLLAGLTGIEGADARLATLCEQHLFIERLREAPQLYRLHPLMREFLLERTARTVPAADRSAFLRRAATAFARRGHIDESIDLLLDAADGPEAAVSILGVFDDKLAAGRLGQLESWLARLPDAVLDNHPALLYGWARLAFLREDRLAPDRYAKAHAAFARHGDRLGEELCAAGALEWHYHTDDFVGHRRWCDMLLASPPDAPASASEVHVLRLLTGRLLAHFYDGSFAAVASHSTAAVLSQLEGASHPNEKMSLAITLLGCLERHKRWEDALLLAARMEALLASARVGPRLKILARQQLAADLHRQTGSYGEVRRLALAASADATEHGFAVLQFENIALLLLAALYEGATAEARTHLAALQRRAEPGDLYHRRFLSQSHAWIALLADQPSRAEGHALELRAAVALGGLPAHFRSTWLLIAIFTDFAAGRADDACAELETLFARAEPGSGETLRINLLALQAVRDLAAGRRGEARTKLRAGLQQAAAIRFHQLLPALRPELGALASFALEEGIEPAYARELIRRRRLPSPSVTAAHWPWRLRIHTLGRFEVVGEDGPLLCGGKAPRRLLALLKALVAFGGQAVADTVLIDALWPELEADAARDAFGVTLHRLRKQLPDGIELIRLQDGLLSLDPGSCWVDARAFEASVDAALVASRTPTEGVALLGGALAAYRGHFLSDNDSERWSLSARERLRSKFQRAVAAQGAALITIGRLDEATTTFRQALDIDDQDESFFQGLMQCALLLERPAEGLAAYQRLRRTLLLRSGQPPSARSETLHRRLREC